MANTSLVIGHTTVRSQLQTALDNQRLGHGLLFAGPAGTGKRLVALELAAKIFEISRPEHPHMTLLKGGNHPDYFTVGLPEGKKDISVEQIREICAELHMKPYLAGKRVAVINDAHKMSNAASNALLMTLEEPTAQCTMILVTDSPHRLPETIVSRCQTAHFGLLNQSEVEEVLSRITKAANIEGKAPLLAKVCSGSVEPLEIASFFSLESNRVSSPKQLANYLESFGERAMTLRKRIQAIVSGKLTSPGESLSLASELGSSKELVHHVYSLVTSCVREEMRGQGNLAGRYADVLSFAIAAQKRVSERNTNPTLELSDLFLKCQQLHAN